MLLVLISINSSNNIIIKNRYAKTKYFDKRTRQIIVLINLTNLKDRLSFKHLKVLKIFGFRYRRL